MFLSNFFDGWFNRSLPQTRGSKIFFSKEAQARAKLYWDKAGIVRMTLTAIYKSFISKLIV